MDACPIRPSPTRSGLSRPAVMERVKRLEESGYITGYHAHIDRARASAGHYRLRRGALSRVQRQRSRGVVSRAWPTSTYSSAIACCRKDCCNRDPRGTVLDKPGDVTKVLRDPDQPGAPAPSSSPPCSKPGVRPGVAAADGHARPGARHLPHRLHRVGLHLPRHPGRGSPQCRSCSPEFASSRLVHCWAPSPSGAVSGAGLAPGHRGTRPAGRSSSSSAATAVSCGPSSSCRPAWPRSAAGDGRPLDGALRLALIPAESRTQRPSPVGLVFGFLGSMMLVSVTPDELLRADLAGPSRSSSAVVMGPEHRLWQAARSQGAGQHHRLLFAGGALMLGAGLASRKRCRQDRGAIWAFIYLVIFGSIGCSPRTLPPCRNASPTVVSTAAISTRSWPYSLGWLLPR